MLVSFGGLKTKDRLEWHLLFAY